MTIDEAVELLRMCVTEIRDRFIINLSSFKVRTISKDGIKELPDVYAKPRTCDL